MPNSEPQDPTAPPQWPGASPEAAPPAWVTPASGTPAQEGASPAAAPPSAAAAPSGHAVPAQGAPTYRSWQPGILPLKPLSFGDFLAVPFRAIRFNRAVMLGAPLLFTLVSAVLTVVTMWVAFNDAGLFGWSATPTVSTLGGESIALIVIAVASLLLADLFSSSIIAPGVARAVLGERIGIAVAWRQVRRRLGSLVLLYLLTFAVVCVVGAVALSPLLLLIGADGGVVALAVLLTIVACLASVPVFVAIVALQGIARALIVLEDVGIGAGLRRAFGLVKGRLWWTILIVFVAGVLINIVAAVVQQVGQIGALAASFLAPQAEVVVGIAYFLAIGLSYAVSALVTYSYLGSVYALLYIDLRMRHEGFDIDLARAAEARAAGRA
ncbi:hypothetical protein [Demequina sp. NBRC 110057]|uniref:hypothetical protein n=1 Tax=Demequina sp. NBRC 110057 TaxID=1570346 RepID=UPI0011778E2D|nr:hypothetical protein [Demequina sp. NBRC 110057]